MVVVFGNKKGGVWKSLTALNLAGVFAHRGQSVCIVDADTNETINNFVRRRNRYNQEIELMGKGDKKPYIKAELKRPEDSLDKDLQLLDKHFDVVLVDTGGYENIAFKSSLKVADIVYLPFLPCSADIEQLAPTVKVVKETEELVKMYYPDFFIDARLLITGVDQHSRDLMTDAREQAKDLLPWCSISSATITAVKAVRSAQSDGLTLSDIKHPKRAMYEILADEILGNRQVAFGRGSDVGEVA